MPRCSDANGAKGRVGEACCGGRAHGGPPPWTEPTPLRCRAGIVRAFEFPLLKFYAFEEQEFVVDSSSSRLCSSTSLVWSLSTRRATTRSCWLCNRRGFPIFEQRVGRADSNPRGIGGGVHLYLGSLSRGGGKTRHHLREGAAAG